MGQKAQKRLCETANEKMDPEQLVALLTEVRTQDQPLHQALQHMQQQQAKHQGFVQALTELPQSVAQTVGAATVAATNPARTRGRGKPPPLKNTEIDFVSWARRTENFAVSVHFGARHVLSWAVERESGTVTEAHAATEVVMFLDTLANAGRSAVHSADDFRGGRIVRHPCGLWVRRRLDAWRRLRKRWDLLTTGRARGLFREIFSPGRAKQVEMQGAVERLEDLMRRYTQRRDARNGQRHTFAEDIKMAALEALLPEELERHWKLQRSRLDTCQKLREEVVFYAEARGYVAPNLGQV